MKLFDSFVNFLSSLGMPGRDKLQAMSYVYHELTKDELEMAYRGDWIARKVVDIPADDATRSWRSWQASSGQITALEDLEKNLAVRQMVRRVLILSRLYGGALLVMGVDQGETHEPLRPDKIRQGDLKFVRAVSRWRVSAGEIIDDVESPWFEEPEYYFVQSKRGEHIMVHPSRTVRIIGNEPPDPDLVPDGWGDSVLQAVDDAIKMVGTVNGSIATLVSEAKTDVIRIPGLTKNIATKEYADALTARLQYANSSKSVINALVMDKEEEWERQQASFAGLHDLMLNYLLVACGAAHIPATRFLGQSPAGLQSTGDADIRNYYDGVSSEQENRIAPRLSRLDDVLIASALGRRPRELFYEWNPLWQMDETQKAALAKSKADTFKVDVDTGLLDAEALRVGRENQLIEDGFYPGIEEEFERARAEREDEPPGYPEEEEPEPEKEPRAETDSRTRRRPSWVADYDPNQPRDPAGSETGGQWSSSGTSGRGSRREGLREADSDRESWPDHIKDLRVPPAWTDVRYSDDPDADLLVIGKDSKGRDQYVYSKRFQDRQSQLKFERIRALDQDMDRFAAQLRDDLAGGDQRRREHAQVTALVASTGLRPGSTEDTGASVQAYGATTLLGSHVSVDGDSVTLNFTGKKGVPLSIPVSDPEVAAVLRERKEQAGDDGRLFPGVSQSSLGSYVGSLGSGGFKTKDLRTLRGTTLARDKVKSMSRPTSAASYKKSVREVAVAVSKALGNTPAVALQSYISPTVFMEWKDAVGL